MPSAVARVRLKCEWCLWPFTRRALELKRHKNSGRFCSMACRGLWMRRRVSVRCKRCAITFERAAAEFARHRESFCSWACWKADAQDGATSYPKVGRIHEHRILGERIAGRTLRRGEVVHHKDENRRNNAMSNLEVTTRVEHSRMHNTGKTVSEETRARLRVAAAKRRTIGARAPAIARADRVPGKRRG